ncbi:MAG: hypothetical protein NC548_05545 [Lachnospiraceae bacterium]|nr:hypothetical protein [Lachnospiraceae bacterium]
MQIMDQNLLRLVVFYGDQSAESACIAQYLETLEVICSDIAQRLDFDAEELLSEGYVHLVDTFRQMVSSCQAANAANPNGAEELMQNLPKQLTSHLKLSLSRYVSSTKRGHIPTESSDAIVDTEREPIGNEPTVGSLPRQLINPFTDIANLCRTSCGHCLPTDHETRSGIITSLMKAYQITITEATAMLYSYENYVEAVLKEHFQSSY